MASSKVMIFFTVMELLQSTLAAKLTGCVPDCSGLVKGNYQSCQGCTVYVTCTNGNMIDNRPCPAGLVWDDNFKICSETSTTCLEDEPPKKDYTQEREEFLMKEKSFQTGGSLKLNDEENRLNKKLMELKMKEIKYYRSLDDGVDFPPAVNFLNDQTKNNIQKSEVFKIIRAMPKGAALHVHDMAMADIRWVIANLTYHSECYVCLDDIDSIGLQFHYYSTPPIKTDCNWQNVNKLRKQSGNPTKFDELLYSNMTMGNDPSLFRSQTDLWKRFMACFTALVGLFFSEIGFHATVTQALQEFYDDNVQYIEIRGSMLPIYGSDGSSHDATWTLEQYKNVSDLFTKTHPDFTGAKNIITLLRSEDASVVAAGLNETILWKRQFPDQVVGFDLVGQEDTGHSLLYFVKELLAPSREDMSGIPFMFHAGETNWNGVDVDLNLIDAVLLNTTRIGHGYALTHHPQVLHNVMQNDIAIEVNPISNQVLGLVSDLRNHPATAFLALGLPMVISSDDPALWGASALSYDYYEAFMGLSGAWGDLAMLKKLALDSIKYSAMSGQERNHTLSSFQHKWDLFVTNTIKQYNL